GDRGSLALALRLTSERPTRAGGTLPSFAVADLTFRTGFAGMPHTRLFANAYNLLNKRYADPGGAEHTQDRILQDGRLFRVGLEHSF
ncbi:MAG: TonB-dependent receptor, partial [Hyphomicrobium sp.]|nr:TonB-dependent receptor [Hyphomicrobium sp.]